MKKLLQLTTLFLLFVVLATSCVKDEVKDEVKVDLANIKLKVEASGTSFKMDGKDVSKTFTITASEAVPQDIEIAITTDGAATEATLESASVIIPKGETVATGKIKFLGTAFEIGGAGKDIKVILASEVVFEPSAEITYKVTCASKPIEKRTATFTCDVTDVFVVGTDVNVPVLIKLDKPAEEYLEFGLLYGATNTITEGSWMSVGAPAIEEGQSEVAFDVIFAAATFVPGVTGISNLKLNSDSANIGDPSEITLNVAGIEPPKATVSVNNDLVVSDNDL